MTSKFCCFSFCWWETVWCLSQMRFYSTGTSSPKFLWFWIMSIMKCELVQYVNCMIRFCVLIFLFVVSTAWILSAVFDWFFADLVGYEVYLVGGCVRDLILKRTPKDFDVITSAGLKEVFLVYVHVHICGIFNPVFSFFLVNFFTSILLPWQLTILLFNYW